MTVSRDEFLYFLRPTVGEGTVGRVHAVEMIPNGSGPSRHTLCGVEWSPEWEEIGAGMVTHRLCGLCDKGIRRRIREGDAAVAIESLRARVGENAAETVEGLLQEVDRTIGGVEVAKAGLDYCLTCLETVREELIRLIGRKHKEEGVSPSSE